MQLRVKSLKSVPEELQRGSWEWGGGNKKQCRGRRRRPGLSAAGKSIGGEFNRNGKNINCSKEVVRSDRKTYQRGGRKNKKGTSCGKGRRGVFPYKERDKTRGEDSLLQSEKGGSNGRKQKGVRLNLKKQKRRACSRRGEKKIIYTGRGGVLTGLWKR